MTWTLDDNGTLTISGTGPMTDYSYSSLPPWYDNKSELKSVVIEQGVTNIGDRAFYICDNITSITVPDSVKTIGEYAFNWCLSLKNVDLGNGVETIKWGAFTGCSALEELSIPASVAKIEEYVFYDCASLVEINVDEYNTEYASEDGVLYKLRSGIMCDLIKFPDGNPKTSFEISASVQNVDVGAFDAPKFLKEINVDDGNITFSSENGVLFNKDKTTLLKYPVAKIDVSYTVPDGVKEVYISAFKSCTNLSSVTLSDSVEILWGSAFYGCSAIEKITLGSGITEINDSAFYDCYSLNDVYYQGTKEQMENIEIFDMNDCLLDATWHYAVNVECSHVYDDDCDTECNLCGTIRTVLHKYDNDCDAECNECGVIRTVSHKYDDIRDTICNECGYEREPGSPASDFEYIITNDEVTITGYVGTSTEVVIPDTIDGYPVTIIGDFAFSFADVTDVIIPDSVIAIKDLAFSNCKFLRTIVLGNHLETINYRAFDNCNSLETITIPASVNEINSAFSGCASLAEINVESGNTKYASLGGVLYKLYDGDINTVFIYPAGKQDVSFEITSNIWNVDPEAFNGNTYLQAINVSEDNYFFFSQDGVLFDAISNDILRYPEGKNDTVYEIPDGTEAIYFSAFSNCANLVSVTIPDSVTKIWNNAFKGCSSIKSIVIPDGVETLYGSAFYDCSGLTSITIPVSLKEVDAFSFYGCDSLKDVYYGGTESEREMVVIGSYNDALLNATWHYEELQECEHSYDNSDDFYCNECGFVRFFTYTVENDEATIIGYTGSAIELVIPSTVEGCPVVEIADYAFYNNTNLISVVLPDTLRIIGAHAFDGCTSLTGDMQSSIWSVSSTAPATLTIPDSVTFIGEYAFGGCEALEEVSLGNSVESIGNGAFSNCKSLTTVTIPASVTQVGNGVFTGCNALTEVIYEGSASDKENITFGEDNNNLFDNWKDTVLRISGDVNDDGKVNNKDFGILRQYLNNWQVTINESNADVNADGIVNNKDMGILRQYLNNWDVVLK